jgi:hypothetical protein
MKRLTVLVATMLITSCVGSYQAPKIYNVEKERIYAKTFDQVWDKIVEWFALNASPVKNMDRTSGFIASDYNLSVKNYPEYSDCGSASSGLYEGKEIASPVGNFNILVRKVEEGKIRVVVTTAFHAKVVSYGKFGTGPSDIECTSRGVLEKQLLDFISK